MNHVAYHHNLRVEALRQQLQCMKQYGASGESIASMRKKLAEALNNPVTASVEVQM